MIIAHDHASRSPAPASRRRIQARLWPAGTGIETRPESPLAVSVVLVVASLVYYFTSVSSGWRNTVSTFTVFARARRP